MDERIGAALVLAATLLVGCGGVEATTTSTVSGSVGLARADGVTSAPARTAPATSSTVAVVTVFLDPAGGAAGGGVATLRAVGDASFEVVIRLAGRPAGTHHAHIHDVTCEDYAALRRFDAQLRTVRDGLDDLHEGASTSTIAGRLGDRVDGAHSITVHAADYPYAVVACGDIPPLAT